MAKAKGPKPRPRKARKAAPKKKRVKRKPKNKGGRPTKWRPEYMEMARKLAAMAGATDVEIADFFKISEATLNNWKLSVPGFLESLKLGKEIPDERMEASLYHSGMGYSHPAVQILVVEGKVVKVPYRKHYPPVPASAIFWLKNRRDKTWRDVARQELANPAGETLKTEQTYVPGQPELYAAHLARMALAASAAPLDPDAAQGVGRDRQYGEGPDSDPDDVPYGQVLPPGQGTEPR